MSENKKFYITTAIPYASQKPHIGNTYEVIMTDAVARYKGSAVMTSASRREPTSTVLKSKKRPQLRVLLPSNTPTVYPTKFAASGI